MVVVEEDFGSTSVGQELRNKTRRQQGRKQAGPNISVHTRGETATLAVF